MSYIDYELNSLLTQMAAKASKYADPDTPKSVKLGLKRYLKHDTKEVF